MDWEQENAFFNEGLSEGERIQSSIREWANNTGYLQPDTAWLISNYDTWEPNPYYQGKPVPHPEDDCVYHIPEGDVPDKPKVEVKEPEEEVPF